MAVIASESKNIWQPIQKQVDEVAKHLNMSSSTASLGLKQEDMDVIKRMVDHVAKEFKREGGDRPWDVLGRQLQNLARAYELEKLRYNSPVWLENQKSVVLPMNVLHFCRDLVKKGNMCTDFLLSTVFAQKRGDCKPDNFLCE
jgi:ATP-dependent Lon protease